MSVENVQERPGAISLLRAPRQSGTEFGLGVMCATAVAMLAVWLT